MSHQTAWRTPPAGREGFSLVEILVVMTIFVVVASVLYFFFEHSFRSYLKVDDRTESVTECWQIITLLREDLSQADIPGRDLGQWAKIVEAIPEGFRITRRKWDRQIPVIYAFDATSGNLSRIEDGVRTNSLARSRCQEFDIQVEARFATAGATIPDLIQFPIKVRTFNMAQARDKSAAIEFQTIISPHFVNRWLGRTWFHKGIPGS